VYGERFDTHTSAQSTTRPYVIKGGDKTRRHVLKLMDVPGHPKLRHAYQQELQTALGIVFVVDSTTVTKQPRPVAEYLHV
jgi:signal recognition particle receptor subunit beta